MSPEASARQNSVPGMPGWKVALLSLLFLPLAVGIYLLLFDIGPTPAIMGGILDDTTNTPISDVLLYSHWGGRLLGSGISGPVDYGDRITVGGRDGRYMLVGITPGLNCYGIRWLEQQTIEFHHPGYLSHTEILSRPNLRGDTIHLDIHLQPAHLGILTEAQAARFLSQLKNAFGPYPSSLLSRARHDGLTVDYSFPDLLHYWDTKVFDQFSDTRFHMFSWRSFRDQFKRAYRINTESRAAPDKP
ncbi:hypothetical protein JW905_04930 [bacterium]|nr:hypothetical protein [candidate division CSSED10-310 bacterium]